MTATIRYGRDASLEIELADSALVANCDAPRGIALEEVSAAFRDAIERPFGFPSLAQCVVPGDRVVLALEASVPQAPAAIAAIVETLLGSGIEAQNVALVRTQADVAAGAVDPLGLLASDARRSVRQFVHDPAERTGLSYLAASAEGKPIYINRILHEADFVVTIGCLRLDEVLGYHGINSALFPTFSDVQTIKRYCSPAAAESSIQHNRLKEETDEASWLLGSSFTVQVVPAAGDSILHVLAGESGAVAERGGKLCAAAWRRSVPRRASLVVAAIEGDEGQQTWDSVGRALAAASRVVAEDGTIVVCTQMHEMPGPGLQQLVGCDDPIAAMRKISHDRPVDALVAAQLSDALQRRRVYLLSRLSGELVEDLGLAPIATGGELARLAMRADSCSLLGNAQFIVATAADDAAPRPEHRRTSRALESRDV